ncbi:MAG: helix-turn-helix transcriptional regulator [Bacilli bacterium]|nr:helix-turn-helix transcriptional regulator [Bacilli bacterium]
MKMELADKIKAVSRMQEYINNHIDEEITIDDVTKTAGYSKYYAMRIFKELTGRSIYETIRALRLTKAAKTLQSVDEKVIDVAMSYGYESHDGFTRAFFHQFGLTPQKYHEEVPPIKWFIHYPIEDYYMLKEGMGMEPKPNERVSRTVTVTVVERPARKLIFLRHNGNDYLSACEEVGCDWEGLLNSIPEKFDTAALGRLPKFLIKPNTNGQAFFVEVPLDYCKPIPEGYEIAELPPCTYLYFNGMPYEDPSDFPYAIKIVNEAVANYPFRQFGWEISDDAPFLGMGAEPKTGARAAVPVKRIIKAAEAFVSVG